MEDANAHFFFRGKDKMFVGNHAIRSSVSIVLYYYYYRDTAEGNESHVKWLKP